MDIRNLIDYPSEREVAYVPTEMEIAEGLVEEHAPEDEEEADDNNKRPLVKPSETLKYAMLKYATLLEHFCMQ